MKSNIKNALIFLPATLICIGISAGFQVRGQVCANLASYTPEQEWHMGLDWQKCGLTQPE